MGWPGLGGLCSLLPTLRQPGAARLYSWVSGSRASNTTCRAVFMGLWIQGCIHGSLDPGPQTRPAFMGLKHDLYSWVSNTTCIHGSQTQPVFMGLKHDLYSWVSNTTCIHGSQTQPVFMGLKHNLYSWVSGSRASNTTCRAGSASRPQPCRDHNQVRL